MTEIEQIADQAEYEAQKLIHRVITSRDVAMIAARLALSTQAARVVELEMRLSQAADNLAACARLYNCPGAAEAERLARKALGHEPIGKPQ